MKSLSQHISESLNEAKVSFSDVLNELKINGIKVVASGRFGEIFNCSTKFDKTFEIKDSGNGQLLYNNDSYSYTDFMDEITELIFEDLVTI